MKYHLKAEISSARLRANLAYFRGIIGKRVRLCILVKANCYGHGLPLCLPEIRTKADWVATATPHEALQVRRLAPDLSVMVLLPLALASQGGRTALIQELIARRIVLTLSSEDDLRLLRQASIKGKNPAWVHVKIDTGMSRSGVKPDQAVQFIHDCRQLSQVQVTGIFTDLATAGEVDKSFMTRQLADFDHVLSNISGRRNLLAHAAASSAALDFPQSHYDMVRIGVSAFGYLPSTHSRCGLELQGILRLTTRLIQVEEVPRGTRVGYGLTFRFRQAGRLGLVPVGYADGFDRRLSNLAQVRIRGHWVKVCGRISMDQTSIDLSGVPDARIGDEVEVISWNRADPNSVENLAALMHTIPYEVTTHLGSRIKYQLATDQI